MNFKEMIFKISSKIWSYLKIARIELVVLLLVLIFDLVTKTAVAGNMYEGQKIVLIPNFLNINFIINPNAAFGSAFGLEKILGDAGIRIVFLVITGIAMVVFAYLMYRAKGRSLVMRLALSLIIAGGMGNFIDRLFLFGVRDFIEIEYFGLTLPILGSSFAIFNFADAALTVGVVMFLVYYLFIFKEVNKDEPTKVEVVADQTSQQCEQECLQVDTTKDDDKKQEEKNNESMNE